MADGLAKQGSFNVASKLSVFSILASFLVVSNIGYNALLTSSLCYFFML